MRVLILAIILAILFCNWQAFITLLITVSGR